MATGTYFVIVLICLLAYTVNETASETKSTNTLIFINNNSVCISNIQHNTTDITVLVIGTILNQSAHDNI